MIGATITRPPLLGNAGLATMHSTSDEQVRVECIAGVVTFRLEDGTLIEFDQVQLDGELYFATSGDAA